MIFITKILIAANAQPVDAELWLRAPYFKIPGKHKIDFLSLDVALLVRKYLKEWKTGKMLLLKVVEHPHF